MKLLRRLLVGSVDAVVAADADVDVGVELREKIQASWTDEDG